MSYILQYFDEVENDINEAKTWYKDKKKGLEIEFSIAIEKTIDNIVKEPRIYAVRYKKIRIAHPKTFPYNIHFYIDEPTKIVVIIAIIHSKKNPKIARKRL